MRNIQKPYKDLKFINSACCEKYGFSKREKNAGMGMKV